MNDRSSANQTRRSVLSTSSIKLFAAAPDLADFLTPQEREEAQLIALPMAEVAGPVDLPELLRNANAFAAFVVDGMLLRKLRIGAQPTLRIFGPGELIATGTAPTPAVVVESDYSAVDSTHLAFVGIEFLAVAHRWPRLIAGLQGRMADGQERLATQLAICQLPRVQDRLLSMLWLLAESWGRVTSAGTTLSLLLTHEALGTLVGARRSTVTLALRELTDSGALVHQGGTWLLLEPPSTPAQSATTSNPRVSLAEAGPPSSL